MGNIVRPGFLFFLSFILFSCWTTREAVPEDIPDEIRNTHLIIEPGARALEQDKLGYIYLLTRDNILKKYTPDGKYLLEFKHILLGEITGFDVSNPMKILMFYNNAQQWLTLDNTLSPLAERALQEYGFQEVSCMAVSNDNKFWIFDQINLMLVKIDDDGNEVFSSFNFPALNLDINRVDQIMESSNYLAVRNEESIALFDNYAQWIRTENVSNQEIIAITNKYLYYLNNNSLMAISVENRFADVQTIRNFQEEIRDITISERVLVLNSYGVKEIE